MGKLVFAFRVSSRHFTQSQAPADNSVMSLAHFEPLHHDLMNKERGTRGFSVKEEVELFAF